MDRIRAYISQPISIAPLASFRALFGLVMCVGVLRFMQNGWIHALYVEPTFFFKYYGFEWVQPMGAPAMYAVFVLMALSALGIGLGAYYRLSAVTFFLTWTYVELLDVTNYLNHYYFVSIAAFLLILVPAHRAFSVDVWRKPAIAVAMVPRWVVGIFRLQMGIVYFFAGLAKVQSDWLLRAQPMRIWLPSRSHFPVIGWLFQKTWVAFAMSWMGCIYDLSVPFLLMWRKARPWAYAVVVAFHLLTWWLFPIGMFPFIMIAGGLIFFPGAVHARWQARLMGLLRWRGMAADGAAHLDASPAAPGNPVGTASKTLATAASATWVPHRWAVPALALVIGLHFTLQVALPFRYLLYPQDLFWHEQGFRFSWRVMLMEKSGYATFHVRDPRTGRRDVVHNSDYLTLQQERMMSTQPDLILQYAHLLAADYRRQGIADPQVYAEVYATLNGSGSRLLIDPNVDLAQKAEGFASKTWVLPFAPVPPLISSTP